MEVDIKEKRQQFLKKFNQIPSGTVNNWFYKWQGEVGKQIKGMAAMTIQELADLMISEFDALDKRLDKLQEDITQIKRDVCVLKAADVDLSMTETIN